MPYQIPIGPFHPALEEPYKLSVKCVAETIDEVSVDVGYSFRGIEGLAQKREWAPAITLVERVCGICSNTHAMTFCMTVETIAGVTPPPRAVYLRTIIAELERLHSHLLWSGLAAEFMGFETLFMEIFTLRERVMDMLESMTGNRVNYGLNRIGGVQRDLDDPLIYIPAVQAIADAVERDVIPAFLTNPTTKARMAGVGHLSQEEAVRWGVVGPVARASGLPLDARADTPYLAYQDLEFKIVTQSDGDVRARVIVRALELLESCRLVIAGLRALPSGALVADGMGGMPVIPPGEAVTYTEAPRGECVYYVASDGRETPARVKIRTPSFVNIPALQVMVYGEQFGDMSLIQASVDPCMSCTDR